MWTEHGKEWRFHGIAPDGQPVHMYFTPYRQNRYTCWIVGLFIGGPNRPANDWHNAQKPPPVRITGNGSLTTLRFALARLYEFADRLRADEELLIGWDDERRRRAYRWLLRYPGWHEGEDSYHYFNPKHWPVDA